MKELFLTNSTGIQYNVVFDQEEYKFQPLDGSPGGSFSLKRDHDEWHGAENLSPETRQQAIDALEKYLLKQH